MQSLDARDVLHGFGSEADTTRHARREKPGREKLFKYKNDYEKRSIKWRNIDFENN